MRKSDEEILGDLVPDDQIKEAQGSYKPGDKVLVRDVTGATFEVTLVRVSEGAGGKGWVVKPDPQAVEVSPKEDNEGNPWIAEKDIVEKMVAVKTSSLQRSEDDNDIIWEGTSCAKPKLIYDKSSQKITMKWWSAGTPGPSVSEVEAFIQELQEMVKEAKSL